MATPTGKLDACPDCRAIGHDRSGDNRVWYNDGSWHCFARGHHSHRAPAEHEELTDLIEFKDVPKLPIRDLPLRRIGLEVATEYGVRCEMDMETGEPIAYHYPLYTDKELVGYQRKLSRKPGERQKGDVTRVGETKGTLPFGSHIVGNSGKMLIVTEGAEDCLAARQMLAAQGKKYRVVSSLGTNGWKNNIEYYEAFAKVVIAFDQDAAGKQAAEEFASALTPGKAVVMVWDGKAQDPNSLLGRRDGDKQFLDSLYRAKSPKPDGIIYGEEVWTTMQNYTEPAGVPWPAEWVILNDKVEKIREAEITMFTGGSSAGKTAYTRRIKHHLLKNTDWRIGEVELEERREKTFRGVMEAELGVAWRDASTEQRRAAYEATYGTNRIFTLDHRSQYNRGQSLTAKFKHLHHHHGCNAIFLDHVTLAVSEYGDGIGNVAQDQMMNSFLEFVETTGCHLFLISHLRKTGQGGKSFEEGAVPSMDDLKGSGSLKQISFNIIGISRNLQHEDEYERNVSQLHVLKCRETGKTGRADRLYWDDPTKSLVPAKDEYEGDSDDATDNDF